MTTANMLLGPVSAHAWVWRRGGRSRIPTAVVALALIAMLFVLLRPVCEAFGHSHEAASMTHATAAHAASMSLGTVGHAALDASGGANEACCAAIGPSAGMTSADAVGAPFFGGGFAMVPLAFFYAGAAFVERTQAVSGYAALFQARSYYARSARILR